MCRLVRIRLNQDCSEGAPGACAITTFIAVASEANVTDQTCAVDGLVAFDDKVNAILGLLAEYLPDCAEPTVIDGNSLVDGINTQLGLAVV